MSEVLQAIVDEYSDEVVAVPDNPDAWHFVTAGTFTMPVEPLMGNISPSKLLLIVEQFTITTKDFSR